jgi:dCTP deaminase
LECDIVAFKAKQNDEPILLSGRTSNPKEYFEYIYRDATKGCGLVLEERVGYLFGSPEQIKLPTGIAAEVGPYSEKYGELRSHFAGFIDPGFGLGSPCGNSITFEIIAYEAGHAVRHGQSIAEIQYEYMSSEPTKGYAGNYALQPKGPQLPKYFKK